MTSILNRVEDSLRDFTPKSQKEFVAFQVARRFHDVERLAQYLNATRDLPKRLILEAGRLAAQRADSQQEPGDIFFEIVATFRRQIEEGTL